MYRNENNQFLYFWAENLAWLIGPDYESPIAGVHSSSNEDARCPNEATGWYAYVDSEWVLADSITASCSALFSATFCSIMGL